MNKPAADAYRILPWVELYPWRGIVSKFFEIPEPDPFEIGFEEYIQLPLEGVQELQRRALREKRKWIEEKCKERNADWIVVCGGEIILSGKAPEKRPSKEVLKRIGEKYRKIPFLFFSIHLLPEIEECVNWYKTKNPNDYYPTMKIIVSGKAGIRKEIVSTFDTGAPITHLDMDKLMTNGILSLDHFDFQQEGYFAGQSYYFCEKDVEIPIKDESGNVKTSDVSCWCVLNWENSGFRKNYPELKREALIGRDILLCFPIRVELDGKERRTYIRLIE